MEEKRQYLEKNRHGTAIFPAEYYHCVYPAGLAGLPVHWHEEFEVTYVRKGTMHLSDRSGALPGTGGGCAVPAFRRPSTAFRRGRRGCWRRTASSSTPPCWEGAAMPAR